jgi:xylulokinase
MRRLIVAHDLGTSGDKASLHESDGRMLASHTARYPTDFGAGGKAEQDPADWWDAFCTATRALLAETGAKPAEIACVALSGQMQSLVLVDATDRPLRPALIWADTRAGAERDLLAERVGEDRAFEIMGHRLDATYTLAKAMWVRSHEPDLFARADGILIAKDYVALRATGRRCTDPSDASGTNAWDQRAGAWSAELLAAAELDPALLPEVVPSATVIAGLTEDAARATGLDSGTPVVIGGGDGGTAALGAGLVEPGSGANATLGSSAWLSVVTGSPVRDPLRRVMTFDHVLPGRYLPLGAMQSAGASVEWLAETLALSRGAELQALLAAATGVEAADEGLFFLPYLMGERAPIWDARARGTFVGLARHHGSAHLARAVLEGVAFSLGSILLSLREVAGPEQPIDRVDAIGGGARNAMWLQLMADTWGVTVRRRTVVDEANSLGAAVVGGLAVGLIADPRAARSLSEVDATFEPDEVRHVRALASQQRFLDLYERLRGWFV